MTETTNTLPAYEFRTVTFRVHRAPEDMRWWVIECLDLPGVLSQGKTPGEAFAMGHDALDCVLEHYAECGDEPDWRPAIASYADDTLLHGATLRRVVGECRWERMR